MRKILILGSGSIKIGEAGEFDYSGSQAIKALKEEKFEVVLINPNIATIQSDEKLANKIYFLPINSYFVEKVIEKERPDGVLLGFGGQTALNTGVELHDKQIFQKYNVKVLGTQIDSIKDTEDRSLFVKKLNEIGVKVPRSIAVNGIDDGINAANKIGFPIIIRSAYSLGGQGSGICYNDEELKNLLKKSFTFSNQVLVEEYLEKWKEIEYEVVRDKNDNCVTVCNMENFDPMGIHTGESIVVAPSQTLTNNEYHMLREIAIKVVRHLKIVGECNIQYALNPKNGDYRVIEINARLSRSSALASKATGYPLAYVAAKLALGYSLVNLRNSITKVTTACFEPALDYCVVKIPRWDLGKFKRVSKNIGSSMKSVGEVMAIGRKFEEALQKAIRMLDVGMNGLVANNINFNDIEDELKNPTDERVFAVVNALKNNYSIDKIYDLTGIDKWFLYKIKNVVDTEKELINNKLSEKLLLRCKQYGFSDKQIGILISKSREDVHKLRETYKIKPFVRQIDTLAAEYPAKTNYLYLTYNAQEDDVEFNDESVIVLGSGTYRIGSSVEFDWCCVNSTLKLRDLGYKTIMINYNPETVSTDYDICDRLYFEEISIETVNEIYNKENSLGVIVSMGGQIPNNIAKHCYENNIKILGTNPLSIDMAEDRYKFSRLLDELGIEQPEWKELVSIEDAKEFAKKVGYPVLIRPSYVLSGAAMSVAFDDETLQEYLQKASKVSNEYPVVISKFIENAKEIEIDAVANKGQIVVHAITEHIENAGIHSGDATIVLPPQKLYLETVRKIRNITNKIAKSLEITGPFNIQFIAKDNNVKVIECNLRASRSFPFVSKVLKINFIDLATNVIMGNDVKIDYKNFDIDYVAVKAPQFSFSRLKGADPISGVEMASTGEVACFGNTLNEAFLKSLIATGFILPRKNVLISIGGEENKIKVFESIKKLKDLGYNIYATENTSKFLKQNNVNNVMLYKVHENLKPNISDYLSDKKLDLVINIQDHYMKIIAEDSYFIRRNAVDFNTPLITNIQLTELFIDTISKMNIEDLEIKSWDEY